MQISVAALSQEGKQLLIIISKAPWLVCWWTNSKFD